MAEKDKETGGVAIDMAVPGSPAIDAEGKVVPAGGSMVFQFESNREGAKSLARMAARAGRYDISNGIMLKLKEPMVKLSVVESHPVLVGIGLGVVGSAAIVGGYITVQYFRHRKAKEEMPDGKVVPIAPQRVRMG